MADRHVDHRLAAIMAADVAGYSRLMEADARATVATLGAYRTVFQAHVTAHGGRIDDTAGDSVRAVFLSAIGAVEAAIAIQDELRSRNESLPEEQRTHFRLGVNLGDVIEKDDGSIYGAGVNVAARLEGLAKPGGNHLWTETFDRTLSDTSVFQIQDNIAERVSSVIGNPFGVLAQLRFEKVTEQASGPLGSDQSVVLANAYYRTLAPEDHLQARDVLERAVEPCLSG